MGGLFETVLSSDYLTTRPRNAIPKFTQNARESHRPSFSLQPVSNYKTHVARWRARVMSVYPLQRNRTQSSRSPGADAPLQKRSNPCPALGRTSAVNLGQASCSLLAADETCLVGDSGSPPSHFDAVDNTTNGGVHQLLGREGQGWGG